MGPAHKPLEICDIAAGDERWVLIHRIASSRYFKSSPRLRELLFYTADCAIREAPEDATEQQIGIRVFGRSPGYNSSEDSIVRTHARLLRQKLAAYFSNEGANEELTVEIPKGHYLLVFIPRKPESDPAATHTDNTETKVVPLPTESAPIPPKKPVKTPVKPGFRLRILAPAVHT